MFYDRRSHCFYSRRLLPVTKQSRIPVPLGSRHDPWKDWEEDFRDLCNTESAVLSQPQANEGIVSWETDFDAVCGLDHDVSKVDFKKEAVNRDQSDDTTSLSISVDNSFSVSAGGSCNTNSCFNDSMPSMITVIPASHFLNNELQIQQTTEPPSSPAASFEQISSVSERQQKVVCALQRDFDAVLELDALPELVEDALGRNDVALQMELGALLFDMKSQQSSDDSESTRVDSSYTASFSTNSPQFTNTLVNSGLSSVEKANLDPVAEDSEASKIHTTKLNRAGALSPVFHTIYCRGHSNERVAAMLGLEVWRTCWSKPP